MSKFVPWHAESVVEAKKIVAGAKDTLEKYQRITEYVNRNFAYDYVRAITIPKKNGMPDVDGAWKKHMGICLDISAMVTGMLRGVGVVAYMCMGKADGYPHAWVEAYIQGRKYRYDHSGTAKVYKVERKY